MSDFRIDVDRMRDLVNKLDQADDRMRGVCERLKKVGPNGLGTDDLDDACDEFQSQWGDGIKRIADASKTMHDKLELTLEAYTANEDETKKVFDGK
ncbi:WXG100 family type VII secretion target [Actinacidiphila sp. bgisy160]|uniref:WXG100 family type VII secretion target n=1 Tax=Actinacidiphila sp. bgisy160 TaxID=3413796 RepID=UPI003D724872